MKEMLSYIESADYAGYDPYDTGLVPSKIEGKNAHICLELWRRIAIQGRNHWLVLTRPLLAGFNAPIDTYARRPMRRGNKGSHEPVSCTKICTNGAPFALGWLSAASRPAS